jgi:hypothetical protein
MTPRDFRSVAPGGPYNVKGIINKNYEAVAILGFNVSEVIDGQTDQCWYDGSRMTSAGPEDMSMEKIKLSSNGLAVAWTAKAKPGTLLIQLMASDGYANLDHVWCARVSDTTGPSFFRWANFYTYCLDYPTGHVAKQYAGESIDAIAFAVLGNGAFDEAYDFTISGFAAGSISTDAPFGSAH